MNLRDNYNYLLGAYLGVRSMDNYDLKVYILSDLDKYIKDFSTNNPLSDYDIQEEKNILDGQLSLKTKLQDALLVLPKISAPMELIFLIKLKLRDIKEAEMRKLKESDAIRKE